MADDVNQADNQPPAPAQPGQVVTPYAAPSAPQAAPAPATQSQPVPQAEAPEPAPSQVPTGLPGSYAAGQDDKNAAPFEYQDDGSEPQLPEDTVTWTASEFIAHEKNASWFMYLGIATILAAVFIYLITKDLITAGFVLFCALIFGIYAKRQPRQLAYQIDAGGIQIGRRHFNFEDFKSFSIVREGAFASIALVPIKRFAPLTTMYYDPKDEVRIANMLAARMPYEEHKGDPVDNFMQRIRF